MQDATLTVLEVLRDALTVEVTTDMPKDRPSRLVLVDLTGDQSDAFILRPRFALTCWGTSDKDAHGLAISAVEAMSREEWSRTGQSRYMAEVTLIINTDE